MKIQKILCCKVVKFGAFRLLCESSLLVDCKVVNFIFIPHLFGGPVHLVSRSKARMCVICWEGDWASSGRELRKKEAREPLMLLMIAEIPSR